MTCLKCGRETDQTFCENCREVMEKYPVKPGTIILLPKGRAVANLKRSPQRRSAIAPEVRLAWQRKVIRRLAAAVAALVVLICAMGFAIFRLLQHRNIRPMGQNYSTVTKPTDEATEEPTTLDQTIPEAQTEEEKS